MFDKVFSVLDEIAPHVQIALRALQPHIIFGESKLWMSAGRAVVSRVNNSTDMPLARHTRQVMRPAVGDPITVELNLTLLDVVCFVLRFFFIFSILFALRL